GTFPGQDGNSYVRSGDGYHPVRYDKQLQGWLAYDPSRPHDPTQSMPVKLDGKGGAEPLPKVRIKAGMESGRLAEEAQIRDRALQAKSRWDAAVAMHMDLSAQSVAATRDFHNAAEALRDAENEQTQRQVSRNQESDPVQREKLQKEVSRATSHKHFANEKYKQAKEKMDSLNQRVAYLSREQQAAFDAYRPALERAYQVMTHYNQPR
ncbi:MAG TPA: hypothetical protein VMA74_10895, partial [Dyella sp.]|uniref:hypothetical protein n=1 Tax=Dyella sp. TaxID=1869338 RepID=UPI002BB73CCE